LGWYLSAAEVEKLSARLRQKRRLIIRRFIGSIKPASPFGAKLKNLIATERWQSFTAQQPSM